MQGQPTSCCVVPTSISRDSYLKTKVLEYLPICLARIILIDLLDISKLLLRLVEDCVAMFCSDYVLVFPPFNIGCDPTKLTMLS